jgi:hypothetical protein
MATNSSRTVLTIGAAALAGALFQGTAAAQAPPAPAAGAPPAAAPQTPRLPDGHPDFTGLWVAGGGGGIGTGQGPVFAGRGDSFVGFEADGGLYRESNVDSGDSSKPNLPKYLPQYWDAITDNEYNGNFQDPQQFCRPWGLPRLGAPQQVFSLVNQPYVLLLYNGNYQKDAWRLIPVDGRQHNLLRVATETWNGDPIGRWEGDTLVIESIGFTDESWLHKNGYIHGFNMKVTERITRTGNSLKWEAKVEDPEYLTEPWSVTPVTRTLNTDANAVLIETAPCDEIDRLHETAHVRSG